VVLVEGPTETLALPILLAKRGLQVQKEGIAILSVGGKGNLAKWYRLYTAYGIPCYITFDNDTDDDRDGRKRRDALRAMRVDQSIIDTVDEDCWMVEERYTMFGKDFESTMRHYFKDYSALEREASNKGVTSKPFIARYAAEHLATDTDDRGWMKVDEIAAKLRNLMDTPASPGQ
jgi:putative ATP-dependent endonuclease of OLD family